MAARLTPVNSTLRWVPPETAVFGSVEALIPWSDRYPAFVRVLHAATDFPREHLRWSQLADEAGLGFRGDINFVEISRIVAGAWAPLGGMSEAEFDHMIGLLAVTPEQIFTFGLWEGEQWTINGSAPIEDGEPPEFLTRADWLAAGTLTGPQNRSYRLFKGRIGGCVGTDYTGSGDSLLRQPTMLWSAQDEFCIATDPDYDSTIVAGSDQACDRLLGNREVEAVRVSRDTGLAFPTLPGAL